MINGGREMSVIADRCELRIERRTIPGETEAQVLAEIQAMLDRLSASDRDFHATVKSFFVREPFEVAATDPIVTSGTKRGVASARTRRSNRTAFPSGPMPRCSPRRAFPRWSSGRSGPGRTPPKNGSICNPSNRPPLIYAQTALAYCQ